MYLHGHTLPYRLQVTKASAAIVRLLWCAHQSFVELARISASCSCSDISSSSSIKYFLLSQMLAILTFRLKNASGVMSATDMRSPVLSQNSAISGTNPLPAKVRLSVNWSNMHSVVDSSKKQLRNRASVIHSSFVPWISLMDTQSPLPKVSSVTMLSKSPVVSINVGFRSSLITV
jgi:hypothetical protein